VAPPGSFIAIANTVRGAIKECGLVFDQNEFRPHLTIMRIRDPWPPACIETFCGALRDYQSAPFPIDRITLFSSQLSPKGAVHTPLREFRLS